MAVQFSVAQGKRKMPTAQMKRPRVSEPMPGIRESVLIFLPAFPSLQARPGCARQQGEGKQHGRDGYDSERGEVEPVTEVEYSE